MKNDFVAVVKKLASKPPALLGLAIIILCVIVATLGANIRPDRTPDANSQQLSIARLYPLSVVKFLVIPAAEAEEPSFLKQLFFGGTTDNNLYIPFDSLYFENDLLHYYPYSAKSGKIANYNKHVPVSSFYATASDSLVYDGEKLQLYKGGKLSVLKQKQWAKEILTNHTTTKIFLLGTDTFGRDLLSRLMGGTIVSLSVGLIAVLISLVLGIFLGGVAGYFGGWPDKLIMWLVNVVWSVPTLLMVIAITIALGKGFTQVFIAVGFTMWVEVARVVRGQFIQLREKDYIMAARLMGFGHLRIILRHLLPNAVAPLIVISAGNFSTAILLESGLSFLGVGAQVPMPSWGGIIKSHFNYITTDYAYLALIPGACLSILTLAFMLVGNGLRDALDVRSVQA